MAQDFYATFGLGVDNTHLAALDTGGSVLAAIQGLYQQNQAWWTTAGDRSPAAVTRCKARPARRFGEARNYPAAPRRFWAIPP